MNDYEETNVCAPKATIITICYNAAKDIAMTMESVLAQEYCDYEYIIQDGMSTDNTPDIVKSFIPKFEAKGIRIIYNREKDSGIYDAMNRGIDAAGGEWINFMNAGDCFYNASVLTDIFDSGNAYEDVTILYGDCAECEYGRFNLFLKAPDKIEEVMPFSHQSVFAKASFIKAHKFNLDFKYSADYDFLLTAHDAGSNFVDTGVVVCITNKDGVSSVNYHDMLMESANILKLHGKYHHTEEELAKIEKILVIKQFVLDHFPTFIKKAIRTIQINKRGQAFDAVTPPWYNIK